MIVTYKKLQNLIKQNNCTIQTLYFSLLSLESKFKINKELFFNNEDKKFVDRKLISKIENIIDRNSIEPVLTYLLERYSNQRETGTYYTPIDVSNFMAEYLLNFFDESKSIMDPTSGTGSLIFSFLKIANVSKEYYKNVFASDIDEFALKILKQRFYIFFLSKGADEKDLKKTISKNFITRNILFDKYPNVDLIISNPPYFETKKSETNYGNMYAKCLDVYQNMIKKNGAISVIVPISFQTTQRMKKIREMYKSAFSQLRISSFSDRPDSLFEGVHQKINIIQGAKTNKEEKQTTKYHLWRSNERDNLFKEIKFTINDSIELMIGSEIQKNIIQKIVSPIENVGIYKGGDKKLFISSRIAQWSKAFIFQQKKGEYFEYPFSEEIHQWNAFALFSSNTFWLIWSTFSDGWHNSIKLIEKLRITEELINSIDLLKIAKKLHESLEKNKKFVNTKQIDYIYKHNLSIDLIDKIDEIIGNHLHLTKDEIDFIKKINKGVN